MVRVAAHLEFAGGDENHFARSNDTSSEIPKIDFTYVCKCNSPTIGGTYLPIISGAII